VSGATANLVYTCEPWEIDLGRRELRVDGNVIPLGSRAFQIVQVLVQSACELVTKDDLMERVWPGVIVGENTLHVHISAVRKALGADRGMLKTKAGRGYRLLGRWTARQENARVGPADLAPVRAPTQPVQGNLPSAVADLIGRVTAVQHLRDLMSAYRVVTATGPGGIGKTRLALEVARTLLPEFQGDVWMVELAPLSDPSLVGPAIASVLGLHLGGNDISSEALAHAIGGRKLLLLIDNCEHLIDSAASVVETVIRMCPAASVLVTSREIMRIEGECTYRVPPLDYPERDRSETRQDRVRESSAVQLFIARTSARLSGIYHPDEISTIAAICRRLDGIPLAIEFAAARAVTLGLEEVLSRLDDRFALLTSGRRTALPKHRTLRATLDWSYELLLGPERLLLQRLAVFADAFSLEAANAVAGSSETLPAEIADGIASLVAKSLVTTEISGSAVQYRLLETTRVYALEKLTESDVVSEFARRHAEYYRDFFKRTEDERETRPSHLADLGNARAALDWCFNGNGSAEVGVGLAAAVVPVFLTMSLFTECRRWSEQALLALDDSTRGAREEMHLQAALGMSLMLTLGQLDAARVALNRSLAIAEERGDLLVQPRLLGTLHMFHNRIGDRKTALHYVKRMAAVSRTIEDPAALALARSLLGMSLHHTGDLSGARVELEAAVQHGAGSRRSRAVYLGFESQSLAGSALARTLWLQGHPAQALERARWTVKDAASADHPVTLSVALIWAISVFLWTGDLQSAEEHIDWLISRVESYALGGWLAVGRGYKGELALRRGEARGGIESLRACLEGLRAARHDQLTTAFSISLAQGLATTGQFTEGMTLVDEAIRQVDANGDFTYMPELLRAKGGLLLSMPQPNGDDAESCFVQSLEWSRRQAARAWELRTAVDLAALLAARGQAARARGLLQPVFEQFVEGLDTADLQAAERLLATLGQ